MPALGRYTVTTSFFNLRAPKGTNINMKNINPYILLCISIFITLLYGLLRNVYSKKYVKRNADIYLLNTLSTVFSIIVILISSGGISKTSFLLSREAFYTAFPPWEVRS